MSGSVADPQRDSSADLRDMAYIHEPYWYASEGDRLKTLLLFFDGIALVVPDYMRDAPLAADPTLAQPLDDQGLLVRLSPEELMDAGAAETLADLLVAMLSEGVFDNLNRDTAFQELSRSRLGGLGDAGLTDLILGELTERGLAKPSTDGVSVPLHPAVRAFVLVMLPQILRQSAEQAGYALHPTSSHTRPVQALLDLLGRGPLPTEGHVVVADLEQVTLDLTTIPLDEILDFRQTHGEGYRAYARDLRSFVRDMAGLSDEDRTAAWFDRREELADAADNLRRISRKAWRLPLATFGLGIAGAAVSLAAGNTLAAGISTASTLLGLVRKSEPGNAYSYLFQAQEQLSTRSR